MFERKDIKKHCEAINALVREYCENNGVVFVPGNIKYTGAEFTYKCEVKAKDEGGNIEVSPWDSAAIASLIANAPAEVKKAPTVIGRTVHLYNGRTATILAYNRKRPKYCWTISVNGATKVCGNGVILWEKGFAA